MKRLKLVLWLALLLQQQCISLSSAAQQQQHTSSKAQSSVVQLYDMNGGENAAAPQSESVLGSIYRKSRQSRCVRCYEDRYGEDRGRYYGSGSVAGGYSSRSSDNWYYPYERYDDRYRSEDRYRTEDRYRPDYDRYSSSYTAGSPYYRDRDDRMGSRTYDRYDVRGYDRYDRRGGYDQERYGDYPRDRYYERPRGGGSYDRDYYDRSSSSRYDYRNYRPLDETYSSTYGSRPPPRPLGGSYLFDRNSNTVGDEKTTDNVADKETNGDANAGDNSNNVSSSSGDVGRDMNNGGGGGGSSSDGDRINQMQTKQ